MDLNELLKNGAETIKGNSDEATSNLNIEDITKALSNFFSSESGGFNLDSIVTKIQDTNFSDIISSWIGDGENKPISADAIGELFNTEKITEFAKSLGISEESAKQALSEVVPNFVDKITSDGENFLNNLLKDFGGIDGALNKLGNIFK